MQDAGLVWQLQRPCWLDSAQPVRVTRSRRRIAWTGSRQPTQRRRPHSITSTTKRCSKFRTRISRARSCAAQPDKIARRGSRFRTWRPRAERSRALRSRGPPSRPRLGDPDPDVCADRGRVPCRVVRRGARRAGRPDPRHLHGIRVTQRSPEACRTAWLGGCDTRDARISDGLLRGRARRPDRRCVPDDGRADALALRHRPHRAVLAALDPRIPDRAARGADFSPTA